MEENIGTGDTLNPNGGAADGAIQKTPEQLAAEIEQLRSEKAKADELARNYKVRAEKAESKSKDLKHGDGQTPNNDHNSLTNSREENILIARVYSSGNEIPEPLAEKAIERVKKIAAIEGITLTQAYASEDFGIWKSREVQKYKTDLAQLGASNGGQSTQTKDLNTPGLSEEEHKALFNKRNGR